MIFGSFLVKAAIQGSINFWLPNYLPSCLRKSPPPPFQKKALFSNMMGFYKDTPTLIGKPMRRSSHAISTFEATVAGLFVSPRLLSLSPVLEAMSSACVRRALRLNRKRFGKRRLDPFSWTRWWSNCFLVIRKCCGFFITTQEYNFVTRNKKNLDSSTGMLWAFHKIRWIASYRMGAWKITSRRLWIPFQRFLLSRSVGLIVP